MNDFYHFMSSGHPNAVQINRIIDSIRGRYISIFTILEGSIDRVIAGYYAPTKTKRDHLLTNLLGHRFCSFELKSSVLTEILKDSGIEGYKTKLSGLAQLRNALAHRPIYAIGEFTEDPNELFYYIPSYQMNYEHNLRLESIKYELTEENFNEYSEKTLEIAKMLDQFVSK